MKETRKNAKKKVASVSNESLHLKPWSLDAKAIKRFREKRELTLEAAATAAGMKFRQNWYRLESGRQKSVELETLIRMARVLRCKVEQLLNY